LIGINWGVYSLKDSVGNWSFDMDYIRASFLVGYKALYHTDQVSYAWSSDPLPCWGAILSLEESNSLVGPVLDMKILNALNSMKPFKALSPDGLHAGFFQRFCMIAGTSVKTAINDIFSSGIMPSTLNHTLIALIPKQKGPETFNHYNPISLCNTVYKIVTKILVLKIKPFLHSLVSFLQTAFVAGRKGSDNIVIDQKLIYTLGRKMKRKDLWWLRSIWRKLMIG
jgi:hypothetical protein